MMRRFASAMSCAIVLFAHAASAHPLAPALLEARELGDGLTEVKFKTSLLQPAGVDVRPEVPAHCATVDPPVATRDASSAILTWRIDCGPEGLIGTKFGVLGLDESRTDALVRIVLADGRSVQAVLNGGDAFLEVPEEQGAGEVFADYLVLGFEHILTGFDHLLFVLGLVLLVSNRRSLLVTVTAFTAGHSITLSLAALGFVEFPSRLVEVAIAFSIYWLAVELSRGARAGGTLLGRHSWVMAGTFGLLHGFGFAGALSEVGLPANEIPMALFSFNVGIELGQLLFVSAVLIVGLLARPLRSIPAWLEAVPAYAIGSLAVYWCLERAVGIL
ncbi:MAG: HupE/UreJ family protein [Myxococcales bacterium]|nr:HupE/UreJ family protein [Myxococcales bacterium]